MPSIALNQTLQGSFSNTDPKINNTDYYDEYDLPTNLTTYNSITIAFNPINAASGTNTPGSTTISLINADTNVVIASSGSAGYTSDNLPSIGLIDQVIAPGIKYKIRVSNRSLSNGNYSLSIQDQGAPTSIISYGFTGANGTAGPQVGTVNAAGKYFPLAKTYFALNDVALASNGMLYGVTSSSGTSAADRIFFYDLTFGYDYGTLSSNLINKELKDTAGNKLYQNIKSLALANTDDKLYAIGTSSTGAGTFYQIDTSSFAATSLGSLPTGLNNPGDLVFDAANNRFLTVSPDTGVTDALWSIPLANTAGATKIGQIGFKGITGLSFEGGQLFGFIDGNSSNTSKYSINTSNGATTLDRTILGVSNVTGASTLVFPGQLAVADFKQNPTKYMGSILDYDGNNLGGASSWKLLGDADIQGNGSLESILVNPASGRFASVGAVNGNVDFSKHGLNGDTRVVGIYIDPTLKNQPQNIGGPFDSQRRFQNDLQKDNLRLLAAGDYNKDGFQDLYFKINDGSAVLRALMFKDGNIQYANYQSRSDLATFMNSNNVSSSIWGNWI